jgi:hypothetical protein
VPDEKREAEMKKSTIDHSRTAGTAESARRDTLRPASPPSSVRREERATTREDIRRDTLRPTRDSAASNYRAV